MSWQCPTAKSTGDTPAGRSGATADCQPECRHCKPLADDQTGSATLTGRKNRPDQKNRATWRQTRGKVRDRCVRVRDVVEHRLRGHQLKTASVNRPREDVAG